MKFKKFMNTKKRIKYEVIIYVGSEETKVHQGLWPLLKIDNKKCYNGLLTKDERFYYDHLLIVFANYDIIDKDYDDENGQIFIYLDN